MSAIPIPGQISRTDAGAIFNNRLAEKVPRPLSFLTASLFLFVLSNILFHPLSLALILHYTSSAIRCFYDPNTDHSEVLLIRPKEKRSSAILHLCQFPISLAIDRPQPWC